MIVQIRPSTTEGRPSTTSVALMLTSLICEQGKTVTHGLFETVFNTLTFFAFKNSNEVLQLLM